MRTAIRFHPKHYDGSEGPPERRTGLDLPLGARMLRVAVDLDQLHARGFSTGQALPMLRERRGTYDPRLLDALERTAATTPEAPIVELRVGQLREGMRLSRDVMTRNGMLLVGRGHIVTEQMLDRMANYGRTAGIAEPIYITGASDPHGRGL